MANRPRFMKNRVEVFENGTDEMRNRIRFARNRVQEMGNGTRFSTWKGRCEQFSARNGARKGPAVSSSLSGLLVLAGREKPGSGTSNCTTTKNLAGFRWNRITCLRRAVWHCDGGHDVSPKLQPLSPKLGKPMPFPALEGK